MAALILNQIIIKTIIFDFDGTLAKLNIDFNRMRRAIEQLILSYGIVKCEPQASYVLEMIKDAEIKLNESSRVKAQNFIHEANSIIENMEIEAADNGELFDYTRELLNSLKSQKISAGIITRNCAKAIKIVFPDIFCYSPVVVCRNDVHSVKPHPEHINTVLKMLGSRPENTLMIGDHPLDIETGRSAGTITCGVLTGRCKRNDFVDAGADLVLPQAMDILKLIK